MQLNIFTSVYRINSTMQTQCYSCFKSWLLNKLGAIKKNTNILIIYGVLHFFHCGYEFASDVICLPTEELYKHFFSAKSPGRLYFIYWKCPCSTWKFEGYFCWIWNSKLTVVLFCLLHHFLFLRPFKPHFTPGPLFAVCPVLSLGNSLTGSSLHRLILISPVSFHDSQRSLLTIVSKTSLLFWDSLSFSVTSSVIFPQLCLFPCFLFPMWIAPYENFSIFSYILSIWQNIWHHNKGTRMFPLM